jgi:hypothetical protein
MKLLRVLLHASSLRAEGFCWLGYGGCVSVSALLEHQCLSGITEQKLQDVAHGGGKRGKNSFRV